jgi:hypothetical protein
MLSYDYSKPAYKVESETGFSALLHLGPEGVQDFVFFQGCSQGFRDMVRRTWLEAGSNKEASKQACMRAAEMLWLEPAPHGCVWRVRPGAWRSPSKRQCTCRAVNVRAGGWRRQQVLAAAKRSRSRSAASHKAP